MLCSFHRVWIVFVYFFSIATAHAQEARVVVVPLGGGDIDQCEVITACARGQQTLRCPSGNEQITCTMPKRVFITSSTHTGDLGGLDGADAICQDLANSAGMFGEFKAWLSNGLDSPSTRFIKNDGPYIRTDGKVIAPSWAELVVQDELLHPIVLTEHEEQIQVSRYVWTNTKPDGGISGQAFNQNCNGFTYEEYSEHVSGFVGDALEEKGAGWTEKLLSVCSSKERLYCFEQ